MKNLYGVFCMIAFLLLSNFSYASNTDVSKWRDHLPYQKAKSVAVAGDRVYAASSLGLFYYDKSDESINRISKVNGLNDTDIAGIAYNDRSGILMIAYKNTNIDFIIEDEIINFPDIKRATISGDRSIYDIMFRDQFAYLSCGFGIVVVDLERREVKDTWYIGPEGSHIKVNDLTYDPDNDLYYAATEVGIFKADASAPNLAYFDYWDRIENFTDYAEEYNNIEYFSGKIFFNKYTSEYGGEKVQYFDGLTNHVLNENVGESDIYRIVNSGDKLLIARTLGIHVYNRDLEYTANIYTWGSEIGTARPADCQVDPSEKNVIWVADRVKGLIKNISTWTNERFKINGPQSSFSYDMDARGTDLWVASGGRSATFAPNYQHTGVYYYKDYSWNNLNENNLAAFDSIADVTAVAIDPGNDQHVFVGTWNYGLMEFNNGELTEIYYLDNSPLDDNIAWDGAVQIGGLAFDENRTLWISNNSGDHLLHALTVDGKWYSFNLGGTVAYVNTDKITIDKYGNIWMIIRKVDGSLSTYKIVVYSYNNTLSDNTDDKLTVLSKSEGHGNLPGDNKIHTVACDRDGEMWIGSDKGLGVIYSPENVFSNGNFDAQQILINRNDGSGLADILLENEGINAIEVDGANRKWIGTQNAGVFLMSADGTNEVHHFTAENSPLLSNNVTNIAIDDEGIVFFGTEKGIVSFKSDAIPPKETNENLKIYPNPVTPGYTGNISISDLMEDAEVRITDVSGNLVFATTAAGGLAVWNGTNMSGDRVHSGVYLVFVSNEDGSDTNVGKILFLK